VRDVDVVQVLEVELAAGPGAERDTEISAQVSDTQAAKSAPCCL
jgi:hypothetical protein